VRILTQGGPGPQRQQQPAAAQAPAAPPPAPSPRPRGEGVDLADVVRRRLGDEVPSEPHPRRPDDTPPPPPSGPRRPVFKGRRGR
jgi:hypothetical protein